MNPVNGNAPASQNVTEETEKNSSRGRIGGFFLAACLVLTLQTNLRYENIVGVGELGLAIYALVTITVNLPIFFKVLDSNKNRFTLWFLVWVLFMLIPVTLVSSINEVPGSSLRDLAAFTLSLLVILSVTLQQSPLEHIGRPLVFLLILVLLFQYFFGGSNAWYADGARFTGGAKNPNQLALYLVSAQFFAILFINNMGFRILALLILFSFGIVSGSDAYMLSAAILAIGVCLATIFSPRNIAVLFPILTVLLLLIVVFLITFFLPSELINLFGTIWAIADEGGARVTIYLNGLTAWLSTPFSFIWGLGAGSFSGLEQPFGLFEAHNTAIDMLTIGGVIGLTLTYIYPLRLMFLTYFTNFSLISAAIAAFLIFTMFHFSGRQPIYWLTLYTSSYVLFDLYRKQS